MNSNVNWHFFFLAAGLILAISTAGFCQAIHQRVEFERSVGIFFFDNELSFEASPALGLGAGYNLDRFIQLNLAFIYTPARQQISAAASKITTDISVYPYILNLNFESRRRFYGEYPSRNNRETSLGGDVPVYRAKPKG